MSSLSQSASGSAWREWRALVREQLRRTDRPAWRRFFFALFALGLALFLALVATAMRESGHYMAGAAVAFLALLLAAGVAIKVVPYLARRTALERWLGKVEYEFTREGAVYLAVIAVISVAALNTGNNLLFIILASLLAGILVSGIFSKIVLEGLGLELGLPDHIFAGQSILAHLSLANAKWVFPSFSVTVSARQPAPGKRRSAPAGPSRAILDEPVYVPYIPHRASVAQRVELLFPRRGRYTQEGFKVSTKFPFGFLRKAHEIISRREILVLPSVESAPGFREFLPLIGAERESFFRGQGHDLYAIRDYQESDAARHVDWKATAKAQQLKVREFTREDERRILLVFDPYLASPDEASRNRFEKAVALCACLAWHFYQADAQLQFLSRGFETPMAPARDTIYPILEYLALVELVAAQPPEGRLLLETSASDAATFRIIFTFDTARALSADSFCHVISMHSL